MTRTMHLKAMDWFDIKGRGRVAVCRWPEGGGQLSDIVGKTVDIDGSEYRVRAVEAFQPLYAAPFEGDHDRAGDVVGILVHSVL